MDQAPMLTRRTALALGTGLAATVGTAAMSSGATAGPAAVGHRRWIELPAGIRPEGITSGPRRTLHVGSLADGRIVRVNPGGGVTSLWPGSTGRQVRGLYHDHRTNLVWAAGNVGTVGHVWAISARTGVVKVDAVVPGAVFLNDLVAADDAVWVTDSRLDRLTVLAAPGGQPARRAPWFRSLTGAWPAGDGSAINANGIRRLPDGQLILNNSRVGGLWAVDPGTGRATAVPVSGGPGLTGGDGLDLRGRTLFDVRGSGQHEVSVLALARTGAGWRAFWRGALTDSTLDVPSTAVATGGAVWAVNARFGVAAPDTAAYWVTRLAPMPRRHRR